MRQRSNRLVGPLARGCGAVESLGAKVLADEADLDARLTAKRGPARQRNVLEVPIVFEARRPDEIGRHRLLQLPLAKRQPRASTR